MITVQKSIHCQAILWNFWNYSLTGGLIHDGGQSKEYSTWTGLQTCMNTLLKALFFFCLRIRLLKSWWCGPLQDNPLSSHTHPHTPPCCEIPFKHPRGLIPLSLYLSLAFFLHLSHYQNTLFQSLSLLLLRTLWNSPNYSTHMPQ